MNPLHSIFHPKNVTQFVSKATGVAVLLAVVALSPFPGHGQPVLETVLYGFGNFPDGGSPQGGVALGPNGALYGTTATGGIGTNYGILYKVNIDGSGYAVLHNFTNTPDGAVSSGALIFANDGVLYGTTGGGGANGVGTIFKMHVDGGSYEILHDFNGAPDGNSSFSALLQATNGALYGTAHMGGTNNQGAIFTIQTNGTGYQVVYSFTNNPDGSSPQEMLIQGNDGALYGTTFNGGTANRGIIFKIQLSGSGYQILHTFTNSPDGANPRGALMQASDGALYGVTQIGGAANDGVVYKIDPDGGGYTVLHDFTSVPDGRTPLSGLVQGLDNRVYGTTQLGGTNTGGTLYRMQVGGGGYETVYHFGGSGDALRPAGNLTRGASIGDIGVIYGNTLIGGLGGRGTVFAVVVNPSLNITPIVNPSPTNGPIVFWPTFAFNYVLQTTTNFNSGPWVNVTNGIPVTGLQLTNLPDPSGSYFRLIWPK